MSEQDPLSTGLIHPVTSPSIEDIAFFKGATEQGYKDHTLPEGKWEFDENVTKVFDEMLARSIPGLQTLRWATFEVGRTFLKDDWSNVFDLGASRGEAVAPFIKYHTRQKYHLLEISEPMRKTLYEQYADHSDVRIRSTDLRYDLTPLLEAKGRTSLVLSVLTLMFVPIEYRQRIVRCVYDILEPGGAFMLVEKQLGSTPETSELLNKVYYKMKGDNGYSQEEIDRKKLSLEGVLVPLTEDWNRNLLHRAGFTTIECYFRTLQFAGYVAIK